MYYLHEIKLAAGRTIIIMDENDVVPTTYTCINDAPIIGEGGERIPNKIGWICGPITTKQAAQNIAVAIAKRFNWDVQVDGEMMMLPYGNVTASDIGRKGGSATSRRKAKSSAVNGKLGGRPKKLKE